MGKAIKVLGLCCAIILAFSGCQGTRLADRSILRGILLDHGEESSWSVTLWWDSMTQQGQVDAASGEGNTLKEALYKKKKKLEGKAFYGQTQQILITDRLEYDDLQEIGELFTSPQMALPLVKLMLVEMPWGDQEPAQLLKQVDQAFQRYGLSSDLYEIAQRPGCTLLPVLGEHGLGCRVLYQDGTILHWSQGEGQLALLMGGLEKNFSLEWQDDEGIQQVSGKGRVRFGWEEEKVTVSLELANVRLSDQSVPDSEKEEAFRQWVLQTGKVVLEQARQEGNDPFLLIPWVKNHNLKLGETLEEENRLPPTAVSAHIRFSP